MAGSGFHYVQNNNNILKKHNAQKTQNNQNKQTKNDRGLKQTQITTGEIVEEEEKRER